MAKRKGISKKTRFEVFKRDSFLCKYCGRSAPSVVLHVDHIQPVSKEGENDILNLVTSCEDCNAGKGDRLLSDDSIVTQQKAQLDELNERREQLEMMLEWRNGLKTLRDDEVEMAVEAFDAIQPGWAINETGRKTIAKHVRKFGLQAVLDAIDVAGEQYIELDKDGKATGESADLAFTKLGGICRLSNQPDWKRELYYIRGIMRNRFTYVHYQDAIRFMENAYDDGVPLDELREIACTARNWTAWVSEIVDARERRVGKL